MINVSVIIVTYNPGQTLAACIESIPPQVGGKPVEIIVVDNNSSDGTVEKIKKDYPHIKLLSCSDNKGYGVGNNRGFNLSLGKYAAILNPDVRVTSNTLETLYEMMIDNSTIGIAGPKTFDTNGNIVITARQEYTPVRLLAKYLGIDRVFPYIVFGRLGQQIPYIREILDVDWLHGSALMIRREVYEALGGFDENFFLFMEDVDLCARARELGWRVVYLPSAEVEHIGSESVSRFHEARVRSYQISPLYYYRKRRAHTSVRILKAGFIAALLLKIVFRSFRNLFRNNETRAEKIRVEWKVLREIIQY